MFWCITIQIVSFRGALRGAHSIRGAQFGGAGRGVERLNTKITIKGAPLSAGAPLKDVEIKNVS